MNNEKDPLARWWWPGQWLHIVYGVWIDQLWYWQNVRPRMRGRKQGWGIWTQGMLGAALTAFALVALMGAALSMTGVQVRWQLFPAMALGIAVGIVLGILGLVGGVADSMVIGVISSICAGVLFSIDIGLDVDWNTILGTGPIILHLIEIELTTVSVGVARVVIQGYRWDKLEVLLGAAIVGVFFGQMTNIAAGIAATVACGFGIYVSGKWATRQVPGNDIRRRLASPYKDSSGRLK